MVDHALGPTYRSSQEDDAVQRDDLHVVALVELPQRAHDRRRDAAVESIFSKGL